VADWAEGERLRIYVDTSVIGGCLDPEFEVASRRLFQRFEAGECILAISDLTLLELQGAPEPVRKVLERVPRGHWEVLHLTEGAKALADEYLSRGVIPARMRADAQHIAVASLAGVDVLVSWNFKHIVNLQRIRGYNAVNAALGHASLEIRTPREVFSDGDREDV
jgi:predicted nucleic acid-binding protein